MAHLQLFWSSERTHLEASVQCWTLQEPTKKNNDFFSSRKSPIRSQPMVRHLLLTLNPVARGEEEKRKDQLE